MIANNIVFFFIFGSIQTSFSLIELPSVEENDILKTEVAIRSTTKAIFSLLGIKELDATPKIKEFVFLHNELILLTLQDYNCLKEIAKLTRTNKNTIDNVTTDFIDFVNEIITEENEIVELRSSIDDSDLEQVIIKNGSERNQNEKIYVEDERTENENMVDEFLRLLEEPPSSPENTTRKQLTKNSQDVDLEYWHETENLESGRRIYHGTKTKVKKFGFMASVQAFNRFQCAGVIIKSDLILTAGSCLQLAWNNRFYRENPIFLSVRVGSSYTEYGGEVINALEVYFYPSYNPHTLTHNLAIIRLSRKIRLNSKSRKVQRIELDQEASSLPWNAGRITILGWGGTGANEFGYSSHGHKLRYAELELYHLKDCQNLYSKTYVNSRCFCAGFVAAGGGACGKDLGGPGLVAGVLTGIVSFGPPVCGTPDAPTVFTKVGYYYDWIEDIMELDPPRAKSSTTTSGPTENPYDMILNQYKSPRLDKRQGQSDDIMNLLKPIFEQHILKLDPVCEQPTLKRRNISEQLTAEKPIVMQPLSEQSITKYPPRKQPISKQLIPEQPIVMQPTPENPIFIQTTPEQATFMQSIPEQSNIKPKNSVISIPKQENNMVINKEIGREIGTKEDILNLQLLEDVMSIINNENKMKVTVSIPEGTLDSDDEYDTEDDIVATARPHLTSIIDFDDDNSWSSTVLLPLSDQLFRDSASIVNNGQIKHKNSDSYTEHQSRTLDSYNANAIRGLSMLNQPLTDYNVFPTSNVNPLSSVLLEKVPEIPLINNTLPLYNLLNRYEKNTINQKIEEAVMYLLYNITNKKNAINRNDSILLEDHGSEPNMYATGRYNNISDPIYVSNYLKNSNSTIYEYNKVNFTTTELPNMLINVRSTPATENSFTQEDKKNGGANKLEKSYTGQITPLINLRGNIYDYKDEIINLEKNKDGQNIQSGQPKNNDEIYYIISAALEGKLEEWYPEDTEKPQDMLSTAMQERPSSL